MLLLSDGSKATEMVNALSDEYSRRMVLSMIDRSLTAEEISKEQDIPISTCYRRIHELLQRRIVRVENTVITDFGKKFVSYRACFKSVSIRLESGQVEVDIVPNNESSDRLYEMWTYVNKDDELKESAAHVGEQRESYIMH